MRVLDPDMKVIDFIRDMAPKGETFHFDNGHEAIRVENVERLTVTPTSVRRELGRVSGVIRGRAG